MGSRRPSVLVCDDEPNLRELIRVSLGPDYDVIEATDGEEALEVARSTQPDLVILDVMMPRLNGLDVLAELRADPALASMCVLVVTAQPASQEEARSRGADGVIVKPFAPEALKELAGKLLGRSR
jgi:two-component system, OmpR family, alkaline phosphatase synthesis response regulator PhoP